MKIFCAGVAPWRNEGIYDDPIKKHNPFILESFYYVDQLTEKLIPYFGDFLLDSGAFTFMQNSKKTVKWEEYIERYAGFINRNNIQKYFELDIDSVVGYDKVLEYRKLLERLTNKPVIPVWHKSRGIEDFKNMCDEYNYVAIGGIVAKEIKPEQYGAFPMMISEAHKRKAKIHGLGFTSLDWLPKCHFAFFGEMPLETLAIMCITQVGLKTLYETIMLPFTNLTVKMVNKYEQKLN